MIPQFGLLYCISFLRLSSAHLGQVLTLSTDDAASASLSISCSLVVDVSLWATSLLAVVVRCVFCGGCVCVCVCFLPVMLSSEIPKLPIDLPVRGFPTVRKFLLHNSHSRWVSIPNSFVSLLVFYILSYLFLKRMGSFYGCLVSSASFQKCFVEVA